MRDPEPLSRKLIEIDAKVVGSARYVAFQMAAAANPRDLLAAILRMIAELRPPPVASTTEPVWLAMSLIETTGGVCSRWLEARYFSTTVVPFDGP